MLSFLYDPAVIVPDGEYANLHPGRKTCSIQSMVERPCLYILGQLPSTDADQLSSYRSHQLQNNINQSGIFLKNKIRVFSGYGPLDYWG